MRIDEALAGVVEGVVGEVEVTGVQYDSRRVGAGDLFVAMRGGTVDGNRFVRDAVLQGAVAVVTDSASHLGLGVPVFRVGLDSENAGRRALAEIAANVLGHPERKLAVSAVTGTNGKTTTAWILEQLLRSVGRKCVLVGTIETHVGDEVRVSEHTTPEASDLLRLFADGVEAGCTEVVMEMSSHALEQERVWGVLVDVGIFTNLTQDHLDYHGTMERYAEAKAKLFRGVGTAAPRVAVINLDAEYAGPMENAAVNCSRKMTYGQSASYGWIPDFRAENIELGAGGTKFMFVTPAGSVSLESPLVSWVNVPNLLAASCAALARGLTLEEISTAVKTLKHVPGRFQIVEGSAGAGFAVVVDYAHTPDALYELVSSARNLVSGRVITVFGCGGDRDKTKRPLMGRAAGEGSDVVVLTSDNPRSEAPGVILAEAYAGVEGTAAECHVMEDRAEAIGFAIGLAKVGDIVLIAGKGHEKVQILKSGTVPFDDVAVAEDVMRGLAR